MINDNSWPFSLITSSTKGMVFTKVSERLQTNFVNHLSNNENML
jgi:hypothetical protein